MNPSQVAQLAREGKVQLVDVRETYEWEEGHIAGARHLPVGELAAHADTLRGETPVVFYCRVGGRSAMAAHAFERAGFEVHNMTGGLLEWHAQGLPLEPEDGSVADH